MTEWILIIWISLGGMTVIEGFETKADCELVLEQWRTSKFWTKNGVCLMKYDRLAGKP